MFKQVSFWEKIVCIHVAGLELNIELAVFD